MPNKSEKKDIGEYGKELNFSDVVFKEGSYVFSDADGIIISDKNGRLIKSRVYKK